MVGYDSRCDKLTQEDIAFAGAFSGFVTRGLCQPLDVLKIRFQLQVEKIAHVHEAKYKSLFHAFHLIVKEEGTTSLWKGHVPAQLLSVLYGMVQFWGFESLTQVASKFSSNKPSLNKHQNLINFGCGAISGGAATVASFPFDVVRTRLVAQSEKRKIYSGFIDCLTSVCRNEGFFVLYRGLLPTFIQVAPHTGVQFMSYKFFDNLYKSLIGCNKKEYSLWSSIISGSLAGLCAKIAIYPLDLTRKRMQIQGAEHLREPFGKVFTCKGMIDCMYKISLTEGYFGFYKGLVPSMLKAIITSALHFSTYELTCKLLLDLKDYRKSA